MPQTLVKVSWGNVGLIHTRVRSRRDWLETSDCDRVISNPVLEATWISSYGRQHVFMFPN